MSGVKGAGKRRRLEAGRPGVKPPSPDYSLGEYSALAAAGACPGRCRGCWLRGRAMQKAVPVGVGAMAALLGLEPRPGTQEAAAAAQAFRQDLRRGQRQTRRPGGGPATRDAVERAIKRRPRTRGQARHHSAGFAPFHCALMQPPPMPWRRPGPATAKMYAGRALDRQCAGNGDHAIRTPWAAPGRAGDGGVLARKRPVHEGQNVDLVECLRQGASPAWSSGIDKGDDRSPGLNRGRIEASQSSKGGEPDVRSYGQDRAGHRRARVESAAPSPGALHAQGAVGRPVGYAARGARAGRGGPRRRIHVRRAWTNAADTEELPKEAEAAMGKLDILVNNAGLTRDNSRCA